MRSAHALTGRVACREGLVGGFILRPPRPVRLGPHRIGTGRPHWPFVLAHCCAIARASLRFLGFLVLGFLAGAHPSDQRDTCADRCGPDSGSTDLPYKRPRPSILPGCPIHNNTNTKRKTEK